MQAFLAPSILMMEAERFAEAPINILPYYTV
jgi:hypothetical protein